MPLKHFIRNVTTFPQAKISMSLYYSPITTYVALLTIARDAVSERYI